MIRTLLLLLFLPTTSLLAQQTDSVMEYLQEQDYPRAIAYQQTHLDTNNIKQQSLLAYTYYQAGNNSEAINTYNKVLTLDSTNVSAHQYIANICLNQHANALAIPHLRRIAALRPGNSVAIRQLSFALLNNDEVEEGFGLLLQAYKLNPGDPKTVNRLADERMGQEMYTAADSILDVYLQKDSTQPFIVGTAIRCNYYLKNYKNCITLGKYLMAHEIVLSGAMSYVTAASFVLKDYQFCVDINTYMEDRKNPSEQVMYYAALAYTKLKFYEESNKLLNTCIDLARSKNLPDYYAAIAGNDEGLKLYKPAIANMDTAYYLSREPMHLYSIGRMYDVNMKNQAAAKKYYKRYLQEGDSTDKQEAMIYKYLKETYFTTK
ncbi:tetratricopeptide repeat protein [Chitinophaga sp.]|uniref:tetratricopeptide repeat protein n=1 Tax=Chitinophaga sp. TaxID=1869181 RepID=UPI0031E0F477